MILDPEVETRPWSEQQAIDDAAYRRQIAYLFERSQFYRQKLSAAGFRNVAAVSGLEAIAALPFTGKDELRAATSADMPLGSHLAAPIASLARIFSTSGTTGAPSYIGLTAADVETWIRISSRSYAASGLKAGDRLISTYNAGPFVGGIGLEAFHRLGLCHIPLGAGNSERLLAALVALRAQALALTPSYALHLAERAAERGIDLACGSVERLVVAGEPGGGEPAMRAQLEAAWGARVMEAMGIGDIAATLWGECEERHGMHFSGRGFVHFELIDPADGASLPLEDGATGELVYTHLNREAAPLLRFRSRDHVEVMTGPCACGRTSPRVRCFGRTDDMLVVRGVNVFPSALREVVNAFAPAVSGVISLRPRRRGFRQDPPLPLAVELGEGAGSAPEGLTAAIERRIRDKLLVTTQVMLVPFGSLPRSDYKSKLVDWSDAIGRSG
jgi:phenylacetate-CoA ligase